MAENQEKDTTAAEVDEVDEISLEDLNDVSAAGGLGMQLAPTDPRIGTPGNVTWH